MVKYYHFQVYMFFYHVHVGTIVTFYIGEFHFVMHICHAIYRLGFIDYLQPIAHHFGYETLKQDFILRKWKKHDEFLLLFTEASCKWLQVNLLL